MRRYCLALAAVLGCVAVLLVASRSHAADPVNFSETFHVSVDDTPLTVQFRAWMPPDLDHVRGIVLDLPGQYGDSRGITSNKSWQGKLTGMGFAIVGNNYVSLPNGDDFYWGTNDEEITSNVNTILSGLADALGQPEINNAPLYVQGISHGGFSTSDIVQAVPERVLGFVADKGTQFLWATGSDLDAVMKVPGLMVLGAYDPNVPPSLVHQSFDYWRQYDLQLAQVVDLTGHSATNPDTEFAFLDQVLRTRYPQGQLPSTEPGNPLPLVDIPISSGWVGEVNDVSFPSDVVQPIEWPQIDPKSEYTYVNGPRERSWLPNETMAMVYRAHNAVPVGISQNELQMIVTNDVDRNVNGGVPIDLSINFGFSQYTGLDVYHEDELLAHFDAGAGAQNVQYTPTETGIHTFIAVASYEYEGQTHYTSKYTTVGVAFIPEDLPGDYNDDGVVDAADYTVWRDSVGDTGPNLPADGTGSLGVPDGVVNELDYAYWRDHFGDTSEGGAGGANQASVPEPTSALLLAGALILLGLFRRR